MTNFIPVFPLSIVIYPGEDVNLHIFEQRYKQLITDCSESKKTFGIPAVIDNHVKELGTLVELTVISKIYENGEMDIKIRGKQIFRILEEVKEIPGKLYSGAIVNYPHNKVVGNEVLMKKVINGIMELHKLLKISNEFKKPAETLLSYDVAHQAGLSTEEEYEILGLMNELQRQEYLKRHLAKVLPVVAEMEFLKERIKLNGHFKNLEGLI